MPIAREGDLFVRESLHGPMERQPGKAYGADVAVVSRDRIQALRDRHVDVLLAVLWVGLAVLESFLDSELSARQQLINVAVFIALGVLLAMRRQLPLLLLAIMLVFALAQPWVGQVGGGEVFGLLVIGAVYTAAAHTDGRAMWLAAAITTVMAATIWINETGNHDVSGVVFFGLLFGTPWAVGRAIRHRRLREQAIEERAVALEGEQEQRARAAVAEERGRIARELHDVVAHAISVVLVQARGGRRLLNAEPAEARVAFDTIERTAEVTLVEMRRLLGMLRDREQAEQRVPQPSLARLDDLVSETRSAGLPVELEIVGEPVDLPPGFELSAYRIVQEGLTNALKHAGPARARVRVKYGTGAVELEVVDDGSGSAGSGTGHGLIGIRERVAVIGGDFEAGPQRDGGYAVRARLPYASER